MSKLTWSAERISALSLSDVKSLFENALSKGNQEVVSLCEAELISRKPKPKPMVADDFDDLDGKYYMKNKLD